MDSGTDILYTKQGVSQFARDSDSDGKSMYAVFVDQSVNNPVAAVEVVASRLHEDKDTKIWLNIVPRDGATIGSEFEAKLPKSVQDMLKTRRGGIQGGIGNIQSALQSQGEFIPDHDAANIFDPVQDFFGPSLDVLKATRGITGHEKQVKCYEVDGIDKKHERMPPQAVMKSYVQDMVNSRLVSAEAGLQIAKFIDAVTMDRLLEKPLALQKQMCRSIAEPERGQDEQRAFGA